jgi:GST-like protein
MLELYFSDSANSLRAVLILEECALSYRAHKLDLMKREQKSQDYLGINPFGMVPTLCDPAGPDGNPTTLTQSTAIMLYLAEKTGMFIPTEPARRVRMMEWLMMAVGDAGPANMMMLYMSRNVPDLSDTGRAFLLGRFVSLMRVVETHLAKDRKAYLIDELSLADFALFPVVRMRRKLLEGIGEFDHLIEWADRLMARPAVQRATDITALPKGPDVG